MNTAWTIPHEDERGRSVTVSLHIPTVTISDANGGTTTMSAEQANGLGEYLTELMDQLGKR